MKAVVFTLGCKVNECESDSLIEGLTRRGFDVSDRLCKADLYIVNTCAVTKEAEKKSRQMASRIKRLNTNAKIIFTGCATQKNPQVFADKDNTYLVTGTFSKNKILDMIDQQGVCVSSEDCSFEELLPVRSLRTRTFVKVQDGCNNFCSYCIIPYLRGRNRSRNPQNVVAEILATNPKEAVITGINLSAYNYDGKGLDFLIRCLKDVECRIRLGSLEVGVITDEFLTVLKQLKNFAPHFHLSLQSGSVNVLKKMNRHYTPQEFLDKVKLIKQFFPLAGITTDVIAGFPTETQQDFCDSLEFIDNVQFTDIHPFAYSPREGTVAFKMKDLPFDVKKQRLDKLIEKKALLHANFINYCVGKTFTMLVEEFKDGYSVGYTENYVRTYVKDKLKNATFQRVCIQGAFNDGAIAFVVDDK